MTVKSSTPHSHDWRLVHGEVDCYDPDSDSPRMGHAWLESRDEVFDPVANQHFSKDKYYGLGPITVTGRYTKIEACNLMLEHFRLVENRILLYERV